MYLNYVVPADYVTRSGYYLCGVYPQPSWREVNERAQSDTEHMYSAMWWAENVAMSFPEIRELSMYHQDCVQTLMIHDLFESKIGGDIPDVDVRNDAEKNSLELRFAMKYLSLHPNPTYRAKMEARFFDFQTRETEFGQICYCYDKIDAVMRALAYEMTGKNGAVGGRGFESDEISIMFTGTRDIVDNWYYQSVVKRVAQYECGDFFIRLVEECIRAQRRRDLPWMKRVIGYRSWALDEEYEAREKSGAPSGAN